jgi:hypothetical protein
MNALTAAPRFTQTPSGAVSESPSMTVSSNAGIHLSGDVVIFSLAFILALVTAGECQSITHLSSLRYGAVLWGWWGCVASVAWRIGRRVPLMSSFSYKAIAVHVFSASVLGVMHLLLLGSLGFTDAGWRAHASALSV